MAITKRIAATARMSVFRSSIDEGSYASGIKRSLATSRYARLNAPPPFVRSRAKSLETAWAWRRIRDNLSVKLIRIGYFGGS
jgi:hypothetical protein